MNKKEVIEKINNMSTLKINDTISHQQIDMVVKNQVLDIISQIDESQKVVVPQFVADWLEVCKENLGFGLLNAMSHSTSAMNKQPNWVKRWFNFKDNQETFAKAWLFGYEVKKEKLYTAMLKLSDEFLRLDCNGNFDHFRVDRKYILDGAKVYQFTKDDLVKYHIWENDAYEIKEVEE